MRRAVMVIAVVVLAGCHSLDVPGGIGLSGAEGGPAGDDGGGTDAPDPWQESTGAGESSGSDGPKFDLPPPDGGDVDPCEQEEGFEFSFLWVANSPEGTVSKIDTVSAVEMARYRTGPGTPNPSRTSVNLLGDVAVVNRGDEDGSGTIHEGSVIKIAAELEDCVDVDDDGQITTSSGPEDVLAWGEDECVLWSVPIPASDGEDGHPGPRPVAWEPGIDLAECTLSDNPRLWVGWFEPDEGAGVFRRLNGATGDTLDEAVIPGWGTGDYGPYGGAVTQDGDLWAIGHGGGGKIVHIDAGSMAVTLHDNPGPAFSFYGLALDGEGQLWIGGRNGAVSNYDPSTDQWTDLGVQSTVLRGIAVDREGRAWVAANGPCRLIEVDTATKTVTNDNVALPGCEIPVGVSIDVEGFVWVVDQVAQQAFKVDPDSYAVTVAGADLYAPYTYSDMTGAGLNLVAHPPAG